MAGTEARTFIEPTPRQSSRRGDLFSVSKEAKSDPFPELTPEMAGRVVFIFYGRELQATLIDAGIQLPEGEEEKTLADLADQFVPIDTSIRGPEKGKSEQARFEALNTFYQLLNRPVNEINSWLYAKPQNDERDLLERVIQIGTTIQKSEKNPLLTMVQEARLAMEKAIVNVPGNRINH